MEGNFDLCFCHFYTRTTGTTDGIKLFLNSLVITIGMSYTTFTIRYVAITSVLYCPFYQSTPVPWQTTVRRAGLIPNPVLVPSLQEIKK
ncbi:hypothetical protein DPMN_054002 [Dreissena polymorpha]|uniref:Uncharacterized protein n=1 Tax=Dreissena polymorpha TaxID=45954 RepID=A0A9D4CNQ1_DREPO|nr:hypothetical protein DPMN_054002 [Dreissena polymorpha]